MAPSASPAPPAALGTGGAPPGSPFALDDDRAYRSWRAWKLAHVPARAEDLVVEVHDPRALTSAEQAALLERCRTANMAVYASPLSAEDKNIPRRLGEQLGLLRLDANWLADEDGITRVTVSETGTRQDFIPYTNRPIRWHTDGYYNPPDRQIRGFLLHCVRSAESGGVNGLIDHELVYLLLRDEDRGLVAALSAPDAMTIPERVDDSGVARAPQAGPVFSLDPETGDLHMRYTARTRSIEWKHDPATREAVARLGAILDAESPFRQRLRLEPGMGLVCNNVLHDRSAFTDSEAHRRLLYRARFYDRIAATRGSWRNRQSC